MSPYRLPGKPSGTIAVAHGHGHVRVIEYYGGYPSVTRVWPVGDYRKAHRFAPQDLVVNLWR